MKGYENKEKWKGKGEQLMQAKKLFSDLWDIYTSYLNIPENEFEKEAFFESAINEIENRKVDSLDYKRLAITIVSLIDEKARLQESEG